MSNFVFTTAKKHQIKSRIGLAGPAGAGKTYSALIAAKVLAGPNGKIAVIDTERQSASLYADDFEFSTVQLTPDGEGFSPLTYVEAIHAAEKQGFDVIVIDSLSHAWEGAGGALEQVDKFAARYRGNRWAAWRDVTPMHRTLVDTLLQSPCHIIATMRSKMDYVQEKDKDGNVKIEKVGMGIIQREGMEYEFTLIGELDINHNIMITKSRCKMMQDKRVMKPGEDFWEPFRDWLGTGEAEEQKPAPKPTGTGSYAVLIANAKENLGMDEDTVRAALKTAGETKYTPERHDDLYAILEAAAGKAQ